MDSSLHSYTWRLQQYLLSDDSRSIALSCLERVRAVGISPILRNVVARDHDLGRRLYGSVANWQAIVSRARSRGLGLGESSEVNRHQGFEMLMEELIECGWLRPDGKVVMADRRFSLCRSLMHRMWQNLTGVAEGRASVIVLACHRTTVEIRPLVSIVVMFNVALSTFVAVVIIVPIGAVVVVVSLLCLIAVARWCSCPRLWCVGVASWRCVELDRT